MAGAVPGTKFLRSMGRTYTDALATLGYFHSEMQDTHRELIKSLAQTSTQSDGMQRNLAAIEMQTRLVEDMVQQL
ncbi:hypothetical protein PQX77_020847, partial [Marasmius sp. AFHP31]